MKQNKVYILISLGILFGAFFPTGIYTLIFKTLERVLLSTNLNVFLASGIAAYAAVLCTVFSFSPILNYLVQFDYSKVSEIKRVFWLGVLANVGMYLIWFLIPLIDGGLGMDYMINLHDSHKLLNSNFLLGPVLINQGSAFLCFLCIVYLIYRKVNTVATND